MLRTTLNLYQAFAGHVATINLKYTNKIRLTQLLRFADFSDIPTDMNILLDFLFHTNTPSGLNLVHLGLFNSLGMLQWDQNGST